MNKCFLIIWVICWLSLPTIMLAQDGYYKNWIFGTDAMLIFDSLGQQQRQATCRNLYNNAVISNYEGKLLAYLSCESDVSLHKRCNVFDSNHSLIANGNDINAVPYTINGCLFLNLDSLFEKIILIHNYNFDHFSCSMGINACHNLYYSMIEKIGGNYEVTKKNIMLSGINIEHAITAIQHANGEDWWLIAHTKNPAVQNFCSNTYMKFLIEKENISGPFFQDIGSSMCYGWNYCKMAVSKEGTVLVYGTTATGKIDYFNFNRCTGELYNHKVIDDGSSNYYPVGIAISPNNLLLYVSTFSATIYSMNQTTLGLLYQYNLNSFDIISTKMLIDSSDKSGIMWSDICIGNDNILYIASCYDSYPAGGTIDYYSQCFNTVEFPDSLGLACGFSVHTPCLTGNRVIWNGLPNFPVFLEPLSIYQASAGEDKIICIEDTTIKGVLLGTPAIEGVQYTWQGDSLNHTDIAQPFASPTQTTMYVVTLTDTSIKYSCQSREDTVWVVVKDCTVGIGQQSTVNSPQIKIYPNPVQHTLYVELVNDRKNIRQLEIFDISGRKILESTQTEISVSHLAKGLYFMRAGFSNGESAVCKIIIQ